MLKQRLLLAASHPFPPLPKNLWTWGANRGGGTAQNTVTGATQVPSPAVDSHSTWSQISASSDFGGGTSVSGLLSNGTLWSWGPNNITDPSVSQGTIGQGSLVLECLAPSQVGVVNTWAYVSQATLGGMAIRRDGTLWSWGLDAYGSLGQGGSSSITYTPTQVGSGTTWVKCYCGFQISFLIKNDGTLWSLGRNDFYGTGLNTNVGNTLTPTQIGSSSLWRTIANGNTYGALGLMSDGTVWSWGTDHAGELGQGSAGGVYQVPTQVGVATNWVDISTSGNQDNPFSILRKAANTLWVCGSNISYQTGLNTNSGNTTTITQLGSATNWVKAIAIAAAAGGGIGLALDSNGKIWSWGDNGNYTTGQNTSVGSTQVPTQIGTYAAWNAISGNGVVGIALQ